MKNIFQASIGFCLFLILNVSVVLGADPVTEATFNLLMPPDNPSAFFLGKAINSVSQPGTPADLQTSLTTAVNDFGTQDFSAQFTPAWLFFGKDISNQAFLSNDLGNNVIQTFKVSVAEGLDPNVSSTTALAGSINFSLLRGEQNNSADIQNYLNSKIKPITDKEAIEISSLKIPDAIKSQGTAAIIDWVNAQKKVIDDQYTAQITAITNSSTPIVFKRYGWVADVNFGGSWDFINTQTLNLRNYGGWLNGGYETDGNVFSLLGVVRRVINNQIMSNNSFDVGGRLIFEPSDQWAISGELVNSFLDQSGSTQKLRYDLNVAYLTSDNKTITLTLGSDQNNLQGDLIALVNIAAAFGTARPIAQ